MGMGEPLDNHKHVMQAISIMTDPHGLGIAKRKITLSTVGNLPKIKQVLDKFPRLPIAIGIILERIFWFAE